MELYPADFAERLVSGMSDAFVRPCLVALRSRPEPFRCQMSNKHGHVMTAPGVLCSWRRP